MNDLNVKDIEPVKPKWWRVFARYKYNKEIIVYRKAQLRKNLTSPEVMEAVKDLSDSMSLLRDVYKLYDPTPVNLDILPEKTANIVRKPKLKLSQFFNKLWKKKK